MTTTSAAPPGRRVGRLIAVGLVVIVVLLVGAEVAARVLTPQIIRDQLVQNLGLESDQRIDVDIPSALLLPLVIVGQLPEIHLAADDVELDGVTADIRVSAQDVPMYRDADWSSAAATVVLDEAQMRALLTRIDGFPVDSFSLDPPEIALDTRFDVFSATVPVGVRLTAAARDGEIVLSPTRFRVAGADVSAEALREQLGPLVGSLLQEVPVCIAEYLPAAMTLTAVAVEERGVVAAFEIDSAILNDPAAQATGSCGDAS